MKKFYFLFALFTLIFTNTANAQYASQKDVANIVIAKVISEYKMNDAEYREDFEVLRENKRFNEKLQKMLDKLSNSPNNKDSKTKQVEKVLQDAGRDIERILR